MPEVIKNNSGESAEGIGGDGLSILAEMSDKFNPDEARRLVEAEKTQHSETANDNNIEGASLEAKARIEEIFEEKKHNEAEGLAEESAEAEQPKELPIEAKPQTISDKYDSRERPRIDKIKADLNFFTIKQYEKEQITSQPSSFKKAVRLMADKFGIKTKRSEKRRDGEAIYIALNEYREEKEGRKRAAEEKEKQKAQKDLEEKARREKEALEERARQEREALEKDMAKARDSLDAKKREKFEKQRAQEIIERDLNARLLKVGNLEDEANSGNSEIRKRSVSFEGVEVPVYDLMGCPFSVLTTTIDYKLEGGASDIIGKETSGKVLANPAIWAQRRDEAEKDSGFGTDDDNARGDTISTSYWNSERNINSHFAGKLIYGFERVEGDTIITIVNGDGSTGNMAGREETRLDSAKLDAIDELEGASGQHSYNEILLRRYMENGAPRKPDYILVENGDITEEALRHAKFFGIPIVNVERSVYDEKAKKRGEELIASISEKDDYEELDKKIAEIQSLSMYKKYSGNIEGIGRAIDDRAFESADQIEEKMHTIMKMEQIKRIGFIKKSLEEATERIESATKKGEFLSHPLPQFKSFEVKIEDVWNKTSSEVESDRKTSEYYAPGNCNFISVSFNLKGSSRVIKTEIFDGKRILMADEAIARQRLKEADIEGADSSYYDALEPVVRRYFEVLRKNRELEKPNS